ncbi:transcriptional attenuator, LytR family [Micromonospora pattaloongensis]|uniref:Transcriptional attenuator, LytR family n=1 Tax=Micromonospora pattaloongensis TaxID=405436 RepID=A0A1H3I580_9ACTN|nr:transcriptional attenuator, LytR family [Micromonospora pattaloongensis]
MIEDDLRATFARHEKLTPPAAPLRAIIDRTAARRRRRRRTVVATAAALVLLAGAAVPALARSVLGGPVSVGTGLLGGDAGPAVPAKPLNFLLVGLDRRPGSADVRADTVMILHVPRDRRSAFVISIPRDARVAIPGHGADKINSAFFHGGQRGDRLDVPGGLRLTARAVQQLTGLELDGAAVVEFSALRGVTDAVGGVRMCLDRPVRSAHTERVFPKGCQDLDGAAAMDLLRQRFDLPDGAFGRDRMGQRYLRALLAKATSAQVRDNPLRLHEVLRAAGPGLTLDMKGFDLADLLFATRAIPADGVAGITLRSVGGVVEGRGHSRGFDRVGSVELDRVSLRALVDAVQRDEVAAWATAHPDQITR